MKIDDSLFGWCIEGDVEFWFWGGGVLVFEDVKKFMFFVWVVFKCLDFVGGWVGNRFVVVYELEVERC